MKGDTNPLTDGGAAILEMNIERNRVSIFPRRMKPIAADLSHVDRQLLVSCFNTAGFGNNDALKAHISAG